MLPAGTTHPHTVSHLFKIFVYFPFFSSVSLFVCLVFRGALKYHIKAYSLAVKDLTEAVAIDCKCALAYFNRAVCYHEMRFFQKVCTCLLLEETDQ